MSDSDCSNCDKNNCEFQGYSYNCYCKDIATTQANVTQLDIRMFEKAAKRLEELYGLTDIDSFNQGRIYLQEILRMQKGE